MRTKTILLTAALAAAGAVSAMAQNVYSLNVVGYVNVPLVNGFNLVNVPLNVPSGNTIEATFGTNVTDQTVVYQFLGGHYTGVSTFFGPPTVPAGSQFWTGELTINPGQGVFVFSPGAQTVTFTGEVMQGSLANAYGTGFSILGSQVPQSGGLVSVLGFGPSDQSFIYTYSGGYQPNQYFGPPTVPVGSEFWSGGEPNIAVAQAFFYQNAGAASSWNRSFTVQ
jgi:hypothetical protein